jgi:sugar (pentulose or hexulose) kinase
LTVLPYFAGSELLPAADLSAVIGGMSLESKPSEILQAWLENVAMSLKQIYALLRRPFAAPAQVIASGGALLRSKVWLQMMANALGHPVVAWKAAEASSRGAVIIAAEQMGLVDDLDATSPQLGVTVHPKPERVRAYQRHAAAR